MAKMIAYSAEAREQLKRGVDALANTVKMTLGPRGRNVILEKKFGSPVVTNDGVTIAKDIELEDPFENIGAQLAKEIASKTNDIAGDGTTTATVLGQAIVQGRIEAGEQRVGNIAGHPFLIGETVTDRIDQAGDSAEAVQASAGQVRDVRHATEWHEVMWAYAMHGNSADHHQIAAPIGETVAKRSRRIEIVAAEQAALPEFADALRRSPHVRDIGGNAAGGEEVADRPLERDRVESVATRDADFAGVLGQALVVITFWHDGSPIAWRRSGA